MKHIRKIKVTLIGFIGSFITVISPAEAEAPKAGQLQLLQSMALDNPRDYARIAIKKYNWGKTQYSCLSKLWGKESAWNPKAKNPHSSAFGIAQMLKEKNRHPMKQIDNGLRYIKHRYDNPCAAWQHWQRRNWY